MLHTVASTWQCWTPLQLNQLLLLLLLLLLPSVQGGASLAAAHSRHAHFPCLAAAAMAKQQPQLP